MDNDIIIILTSTVNVNFNKIFLHQMDSSERLKIYIKSVTEWLNKTKLKIILVENSGYTFEELNNEKELFKDRFEIISYSEGEVEERDWLVSNNSKGESELFSIRYAFKNSRLINKDSFIIKITARYFIPDLEDYLSLFKLNNFDCLVQYDRNRCEMVGSHYKNMEYMFNKDVLEDIPIFAGHVESIYKHRTSKYKNILISKTFQIEKTQCGGINNFFTEI